MKFLKTSRSSDRHELIVLAGNSHKKLAQQICGLLNTSLGESDLFTKSDLETHLSLSSSVRGKSVFIVQTGSDNVNNDIIEMLILVSACKASACKRIVLVMPYLPYSRHCKRRGRTCVEGQLVAQLIQSSGVDMLLTLDLFMDEIQGFFTIPVENLRASAFLMEYVRSNVQKWHEAVIVALDSRSVHRAEYYAKSLNLTMAFLYKSSRVDDGLQGTLRNSTPEQRPLHLVGAVNKRNVIVVGNLIDEAVRFSQAADLLRTKGAKRIYAMATHGLLYESSVSEIQKSQIDELILTNSIPNDHHLPKCPKLKIVDMTPLFAEVIRRINNNERLSGLYQNTDEPRTGEEDD